jgi:hypothetical protein
MTVRYWTYFPIMIWVALVLSAIYLVATGWVYWLTPAIYIFMLVCHRAYYQHRLAQAEQLCCCGHSKEAHGASLMSWAEAQERSRKGDTRYVDYHDDCQCLTYVPSIRHMYERTKA